MQNEIKNQLDKQNRLQEFNELLKRYRKGVKYLEATEKPPQAHIDAFMQLVRVDIPCKEKELLCYGFSGEDIKEKVRLSK